MGNCAAEDNPTFRTINSNKNQFINNIYSQDHSESSISNETNNKTYSTYTHNGVYKINRKKKPSNKKLNKIDYYNNIYPIKDNNTNNSTTSKSKFTDSSFPNFSKGKSPNYKRSENFMRINSIESDKSGCISDISYINRNMDLNNFNKNFQEKKKLIRRKIHSSDKALETMTEETLNKMNKEKSLLNNNNNINYQNNNNNNLSIIHNINFKCIKTLECHEDKIVCAIQLIKGNIATGSYDGTIKLWDLNLNLNNQKTLKEEGKILCLLEFEENMLLSGTEKNNINLWNLNTFQLNFSFKGHQFWVNALTKINNDYFASCSNDNQIRIWDYKNKICVKILDGHLNGIFTLITLKNGCICSGGADLSIKVWDINSGKCIMTLLGHKKWIKCLCQLSNGYIISGSDDKTIKAWKDDKCISTLEGHSKSVRTLCQISSGLFASGSFDKTIKIWDIFNFDYIYTIFGHKDLILNIIRIKTGEIISCSNDHEIKIWKQLTN